MNKVEEEYVCYWEPCNGERVAITGEDAKYLVSLFVERSERARYEHRMQLGTKLYGTPRDTSEEAGDVDRSTTGELSLCQRLIEEISNLKRSGVIRMDGDDVLFRNLPSLKTISFDPSSVVVSGAYADRVRSILGLVK